jgi:putative ABC transport system permease protein
MKTPIALLNLWYQPARSLVSAAGVSFALLLVFVQLGFLGAVSHTATNSLGAMRFDLLIRSVNYAHLFEPDRVDRQSLKIARNTPGVEQVFPLWMTLQNWQRVIPDLPEGQSTAIRPIAVMGVDPQQHPFLPPDIQSGIAAGHLNHSSLLLIDARTQAEYGPNDGRMFASGDIGTEAEIAGSRFRISGIYQLGTGLAANGSVIISDRGFARISPWNPEENISLGLVQLSAGESASSVQRRLQKRFQLSTASTAQAPIEAVTVLTRQQALTAEQYRWLWQTPIGLIFQMGVGISLVVGAAIVYMVLATDVTEKLPEYATLLAVGYSRAYLARIVMGQAFLLACLGFAAAWMLAEIVYLITSSLSGIQLTMEPSRILVVFSLGLTMCCISGLLALRQLWKAEPANLF